MPENATKRIAPQLTEVSAAIKMPTKKNNRGSKSLYPFDSLTAVGQSFGMKNKTAEQLASIISNANKKHRSEKKDENGNIVYHTKTVTGPNGEEQQVPNKEKPIMVIEKEFAAFNVTEIPDMKLKDGKGPEGEISRVFLYRANVEE